MSKIKFYTSDGQMYFEMEEEKVNKEQKIRELSNKIEKSRVEIDALKEELEKLQKKPYKISYPEGYPKERKIMWYIDNHGTFSGYDYYATSVDKIFYKTGLLFDTREEAEQFIKEQTLIKKIKCWTKEQQGDWKPDWDNDEIKYFVVYDNRYGSLGIDFYKTIYTFSKLPYFKSEEIAKACIDEFGDEILEVFC